VSESIEARVEALRSDAAFMEAFRAVLAARLSPGVDPGYVLDVLRIEFASDVPGHAEALRLVLLAELRAQNQAARDRQRQRRLNEHLVQIAEEAAIGIGEAVDAAGVGTIEELIVAQPEKLDELARRLGEKWEVPLSRRSILSLIGWP
jgi:hypothetical protein